MRDPWCRALGLGLGYVADLLFADPARLHPVAGFGQLAGSVEQRTYADRRSAGVTHVALLVGAVALASAGSQRVTRTRPLLDVLSTAVATWAVLGGASLDREAVAVAGLLAEGRLADARL